MNLVEKALRVAATAHQGQRRKGTDVPYITHPVGVALLLAAAGADETLLAAALLHDLTEDTPWTLADLRREFGAEVAALVAAVSEPDKTLPWEERKRHTLDSLPGRPLPVRLLVCADKLHNLQTILHDQAELGEEVWRRFSRGKRQQAWYYRGVLASLLAADDGLAEHPLFRQYEAAVQQVFAAQV